MFVLDKLLTMILLPTALMVELTVIGLLCRRWRAGRMACALGASCLALCMVLPLDRWVVRPLEDRFPQVTTLPEHVDGIIVLGGAIDDLTSRDRNTPILNGGANRMTSLVILARHYPEAKLVFTGGSGSIVQGLANEAEYARILFEQLGLPPGRVTYESRSRTTWENAVYTKALVHPAPGERWLLITSASHMPRSVGVFREAGWSVQPYPVGFLTRDHLTGYSWGPGNRLATLDWGVHEWLGMVAYRLSGHSSAFFPAR